MPKDNQRQPRLVLEEQKEAVTNYLGSDQCKIIGEYIEIEGGTKKVRNELQKAMSECRMQNARLIVAKLNRLSSDLELVKALHQADVRFVMAEEPELNESNVHVLSTIAHHEHRLISQTTRTALSQAKQRGVRLGNPCFAGGKQIPGSGNTEPARQEKTRLAREYAAIMMQEINEIKRSGSLTLRAIATELNNRGLRTRRNKPWSATAVMRILRNT